MNDLNLIFTRIPLWKPEWNFDSNCLNAILYRISYNFRVAKNSKMYANAKSTLPQPYKSICGTIKNSSNFVRSTRIAQNTKTKQNKKTNHFGNFLVNKF